MDLRKRLARNVRFIRERHGWSQERLAEISGLHRTYVSGIERGVRNPTIDILAQLAKALCVEPVELLTDKRVGMGDME